LVQLAAKGDRLLAFTAAADRKANLFRPEQLPRLQQYTMWPGSYPFKGITVEKKV
jgi:hypothetical protein